MIRRFLALLMVISCLLVSVPVLAEDVSAANTHSNGSQSPVIYSETITVTENGGRFQVGFVNLEFKKEFLDFGGQKELTFHVTIDAVNGEAGIQIKPDQDGFCKRVYIRVDAYDGLLYDEAKGENIPVSVKKQMLKVKHFSRYAFL